MMTVRWTPSELQVLKAHYPAMGVDGVVEMLPGRSQHSIHVKAHRLGLEAGHHGHAPRSKVSPSMLVEIMALHDAGQGCERIGKRYGLAECTISNAVLIELGRRAGYEPLARDDHGCLLPTSIETLRLLLRKGWKGRDIQMRCGVSAACVAEQRRRYQRDLKARGKAPLPPAGGGEAYSGAKVPKAQRAAVEALYLEGYGAQKIVERTGVSYTTVQRIRQRLVRRLKRKGETLAGCDASGRRHRMIDHAAAIPDAQREQLRALLLDRVPVARAAKQVGMGSCSAYRERDRLKAEMAERGEMLSPPIRLGSSPEARRLSRQAAWLPSGKRWIVRYRQLLKAHPEADARALVLAEISGKKDVARAERQRPKSFEEQLEALRSGKGRVEAVVPLVRPGPAYTLGGVATGAL